MKILALSAGDMGHATELIAGFPGIEVQKLSTRGGPFPKTPYHRQAMARHHLDLVKHYGSSAVDTIYLDTFGDYGLDMLRTESGVPVVGAGQSSLFMARSIAQRFAIITVWPESMRFIYTERLQATGTGEACAAITHVGSQCETPADVLRQLRSPAGTLRNLVLSAARRAIQDRNIDAIVLGCTCMAGMHSALVTALPVPVVCPSRTGLLFAAGVAGCWKPQ